MTDHDADRKHAKADALAYLAEVERQRAEDVQREAEHDPLGLACEHGMLARSCEVCELQSTIRALEAKVREKHEALESACSLAERTHRMLQDLLARIHRDGGHYATEHGLEKSSEDADQIVSELFADRDHWKRSFDRMAGDAFAEKRRNESLSADRDRLNANYDKLLTEHIKVTDERNEARQERDRIAAEVERLTKHCSRLEFANDTAFAEVAALREDRDTAIARIRDMLMDDDGQAWKEARKFIEARRAGEGEK